MFGENEYGNAMSLLGITEVGTMQHRMWTACSCGKRQPSDHHICTLS